MKWEEWLGKVWSLENLAYNFLLLLGFVILTALLKGIPLTDFVTIAMLGAGTGGIAIIVSLIVWTLAFSLVHGLAHVVGEHANIEEAELS